MIIATQGVSLFAHFLKRSEVIHSLPYMECSYMLNVIQGVKLYVQCYAWSEAIRSMLYME